MTLEEAWEEVVDMVKRGAEEVGAGDSTQALEVVRAALPQWVRVEERLPEEDKDYLVFQRHTCERWETVRVTKDERREIRRIETWTEMRVLHLDRIEWRELNVTHWMPLPLPPGEEG